MEKEARLILEKAADKGWHIVVDESRKVPRITARKATVKAFRSLSYITAQPAEKAVVDKAPRG